MNPVLVTGAVPHETAELAARAGALPLTSFPWPLAGGELGGVPVRILSTGVGPAEAAAALTWAALDLRPTAIVNVGSAGSFDSTRLPVGAVALVEAERFGDVGTLLEDGTWRDGDELGLGVSGTTDGWIPLARADLDTDDLPFPVTTGRGLTVHHVTGTASLGHQRRARSGALVESMEGAAAALVGLRLGIPVHEVRGASNLVGEQDRGGWQVRLAGRNAQRVAARLVAALAHTTDAPGEES